LKLVEEHGIEYLILHGLDLAIGGAGDQVGIDLGNLFGDQALLEGFGGAGRPPRVSASEARSA
jgi:hypothetical protein